MDNGDVLGKFSRLEDEIMTSAQLIKMGLCELNRISDSNDRYFAPTLLLSYGFERLLKSLIILCHCDGEFNFPDRTEITRIIKEHFSSAKGHDLGKLLKELVDYLYYNYYAKKC